MILEGKQQQLRWYCQSRYTPSITQASSVKACSGTVNVEHDSLQHLCEVSFDLRRPIPTLLMIIRMSLDPLLLLLCTTVSPKMPEMSQQGSSLFWHNQDYKSLSKNGSERIPKPTKPSSATDSGPERWPPSARPPSHTVFTRRIQPYSIDGYSGIDRAVSTVATPPLVSL